MGCSHRDRNRPATGNRVPPGRDRSPDRGWKPDPSKRCLRPTNAPSGLRQLEPDRSAAPRLAPSVTARIEELDDRVEVQWGLPVVSSLDALDDRIPRRLRARSVTSSRALISVDRHARTSRARVRLGLRARAVTRLARGGDDAPRRPMSGPRKARRTETPHHKKILLVSKGIRHLWHRLGRLACALPPALCSPASGKGRRSQEIKRGTRFFWAPEPTVASRTLGPIVFASDRGQSKGVWRHPLGTKGSIVYCR
jgi:hypothetical protein